MQISMKKFLIILVFIITIIGVSLFVLVMLGHFSDENTIDVATEQSLDQSLEIIYAHVQDNTIRNFGYGVVLFYEDERISMLYYEQTDSFLISIDTMSTLANDIQYAGQTFLSTLDISEATACQLHVEIAVPHYADFQKDGVYGLQFCPGSTKLETI